MAVSEDVMKLVRTVERLPREDQEKIWRIVDLLSLVPLKVQDRTQQMLRELLSRAPASKQECLAGMDGLIEYLESNVTITREARARLPQYAFPQLPRARASRQ
jgi:hypothetical protein